MQYIYSKKRKIPNKTSILIFPDDYNEDIPEIKTGIKTIILGKKFNKKLFITTDTVEEIIIGDGFDNELVVLPKKLKVLQIGNNFNGKLDALPKKLKVLKLGDKFNKNIDILPIKLEELYLGNNFTEHIDFLPKKLKILHINSDKFNKSIDNLPKELEELVMIARKFNQNVNNIPKSITKLLMDGFEMTSPIPFLPKLKEITVAHSYNENIYIVPTLQKIELGKKFNRDILKKLPESLESIVFDKYSDYNYKIEYPLRLKVLKLGRIYNHDINELPDTVEELVIRNNYKYPILKLPKNLKHFEFWKMLDNLSYDEKKIYYVNLEKAINELYNLHKLLLMPFEILNLINPLDELEIFINDTNKNIFSKMCINVSVLIINLENNLLNGFDSYINYNEMEDIDNLPLTLEKIIIKGNKTSFVKDKITKIPFNCEIIEIRTYTLDCVEG